MVSGVDEEGFVLQRSAIKGARMEELVATTTVVSSPTEKVKMV